MRLVACANCHAQYDVTDVVAKTIPCRCGEAVENRPHAPVDAVVRRCGSCGALVSGDSESCTWCGSAIVSNTSRLPLICPECYARNADDSRFCTACGVPFKPEAVVMDGHELPCPVCSVLMPPRQISGVLVNECPRCHGLFVPGEGFDHLVTRALAHFEAGRDPAAPADPRRHPSGPRVTGSNPAAQRVQYRKCPECDGYMLRRNFRKSSGVIVDVCKIHGTWLDADELEQIAGFILSGKATSPLLEAPAHAEPRPAAFAVDLLRARLELDPLPSGIRSLADLLTGLLR